MYSLQLIITHYKSREILTGIFLVLPGITSACEQAN